MVKQFNKTDYLLWLIIVVYTGIIYATLSIVSKIRKFLAEKFGPDVFDHIYWFFGIIAAVLLYYCIKKYRGKKLFQKLAACFTIACIYGYYLSGMQYPVERIHFLEYGLLGALILAAFSRHIRNWISIILSLNLVYWIGLGDEAIQGILVNRVGEIRDSVINLFSGMLGIALLGLVSDSFQQKSEIKIKYIKALLLVFGASTLFTTLFIYTIHGFGYRINMRDPGIIFSSLTWAEISDINKYSDNIPDRKMTFYNNEAVRHLFQREFYFTNKYKTSKGTFYKDYNRCFNENRVLEVFYKRFLNENASESSGRLISILDREVADKVMDNPVMWSDSLRFLIESYTKKRGTWIFASRVKSGIITSFTLKDLLFYCILIFGILCYGWYRLPKRE